MQRVDRDLPAADVTTDGSGKVVTRFDTPGDVEDATALWTNGPENVAAEQVVFDEDDGTLVVRVDDGALAELVDDADADDGETRSLDLYVGYESSEYDRVYFDYSRLNATVEATVRERGRPALEWQYSDMLPAPDDFVRRNAGTDRAGGHHVSLRGLVRPPAPPLSRRGRGFPRRCTDNSRIRVVPNRTPSNHRRSSKRER